MCIRDRVRIALGALVPGLVVDRVAAGQRGDELAGLGAVETLQLDAGGPGQPGQFGDGLLDATEPRGLVVPERQDEAEPPADGRGRQVDEEVAGGAVGG